MLDIRLDAPLLCAPRCLVMSDSVTPWAIARHKILQARLQQYVNHTIPDVQAGCRKGRGTRDQIANIHWIMEKAIEFQKNM